jgi:hypothetical protein
MCKYYQLLHYQAADLRCKTAFSNDRLTPRLATVWSIHRIVRRDCKTTAALQITLFPGEETSTLRMQSVFWEQVKAVGDVPAARSGHSFTRVGSRYLLFGGMGCRSEYLSRQSDCREYAIPTAHPCRVCLANMELGFMQMVKLKHSTIYTNTSLVRKNLGGRQ